MNKVNKADVTLSMLEIIYKDNFVTRGDSWRLHRSLIGSCCYNSQKSNFLDMRSSINELWMGADKVACGVVGETTKVYHFVYIKWAFWRTFLQNSRRHNFIFNP